MEPAPPIKNDCSILALQAHYFEKKYQHRRVDYFFQLILKYSSLLLILPFSQSSIWNTRRDVNYSVLQPK